MAHARLQAALWRDTAFLASLGVMDYSLLVGVDRKNHVLVAGIIDFVRQVGWAGASLWPPLLLQNGCQMSGHATTTAQVPADWHEQLNSSMLLPTVHLG